MVQDHDLVWEVNQAWEEDQGWGEGLVWAEDLLRPRLQARCAHCRPA